MANMDEWEDVGGDDWEDVTFDSSTSTVSAPAIPQPKQSKLKLPSLFGVSKLGRVAQGMADPSIAAAQLVGKGLTAMDVPYGERITDYYNATNRGYEQERADAGQEGIDAYRIAGNVLSPSTAVIAATAPAVAPATLAGKAGLGMAQGAAFGGLTPVQDSSDGFLAEKGKQIGTGAALGAALPAVGTGLSRVIMPKAAKDAEMKLLKEAGVNPTIGQALGGRWNTAEQKLTSTPVFGDMIAIARSRATDSVESAAHNKALSFIGEKLPSSTTGKDAVLHTKQTIGKVYDDVLGKIGAIIPDNQFNANVSKLDDMVNVLAIPEGEKQVFRLAVNDVKAGMDANGVMTAESYKLAESNLSEIIKALDGASANNAYAIKMKDAVSALKDELKGTLYRSAGDEAKNLSKADAAWKAFKVIEKAADSSGTGAGHFTPAQLSAAVKSMEKNIGKRTTGKAMLQDLSDVAKERIGTNVPNSATADRALYALGTLGGGYAINPALAATTLGGAAMYTRPVQNALVKTLTERPESFNMLSQQVGNLQLPRTVNALVNAQNQ